MYEKEMETAEKAAREAGSLLKAAAGIYIDAEAGRDIKLSSDKNSENIIMNILSETGYSILSEEYGFDDRKTEFCWIVDPLDGTMNYLKGMRDLSCVSIALYQGPKPLLGVVYRYMADEMYGGIAADAAWMNGRSIRCSDISFISKAVLGTGLPVKRDYDDASLRSFVRDMQRFKKVRMLGSAAMMAVYVACGKLDAYMEENVMLWDIAAAAAIVEAAGGVCDLQMLDENKCICKCFANAQLKTMFENLEP